MIFFSLGVAPVSLLNPSAEQYKCKHCSVIMFNNDDLYSHMNLFHLNRNEAVQPFKCNLCSVNFEQVCVALETINIIRQGILNRGSVGCQMSARPLFLFIMGSWYYEFFVLKEMIYSNRYSLVACSNSR